MKKFIHAGQAYKEYDGYIFKVERWLEGRVPFFRKVDSQILHKRLAQRIVTLTLNPYVFKCSKRAQEDLSLNPTEKNLLLNGLYLNTESGEIKMTARAVARGIVEFFYEWTAIFIANIVPNRLGANKINTKAVLIFGVPKESLEAGGSGKQFEDYCDQGQIKILKTQSIKVVQSLSDVTSSNVKFRYVKRPVVELVRHADLSLAERFQFLTELLIEPIIFLSCVVRSPLLSILGRDFGLLRAISFLAAKNCIESVVITNTNHGDQYLWMRNSIKLGFQVHKIHYSQNSRSMVYKFDKLSVDHPILRHIYVDEHWVWTHGYEAFLRGHGHLGKVHVVGPIMFYNAREDIKSRTHKIRVTIFDVTPIYDHVSNSIGLINNYYNSSNMMAFITNITRAIRELEVENEVKYELCLKHKRNFNKNHDRDYIDYCNQLAKEQVVTMIDYDSNIFTLIKQSQMVISIPYTSTSYIATSLGVPSLYYDPSAELCHSLERVEGLSMVDDERLLKEWILEHS